MGEFLSLGGIYQVSSWVALVCTTGIILGAALHAVPLSAAWCSGCSSHEDAAAMTDLTARELAMVIRLASPCCGWEIYPESFLAPMRSDIAALDARVARAKPAGDAQVTPGKPVNMQLRAR